MKTAALQTMLLAALTGSAWAGPYHASSATRSTTGTATLTLAMLPETLPAAGGSAAKLFTPAQTPTVADDTATEQPVGGLGLAPKPYPRGAAVDSNVEVKLEDNNNITMALNHADIGQVLQLLAEARKVNIVAGQDVTGTISISLYNVSFEKALDAILGVNGFTFYKRGGVYYITTEKRKADLPINISDMATQTFYVNHAMPEDLAKTVAQFLSPAGKVVLSNGKTLVIEDDPVYLRHAADLIRQLDIPKRQVQIDAKILKITHNHDSQIGVTAQLVKKGNVQFTTPGFARDLATLDSAAKGLFVKAVIDNENFFLEALANTSQIEVLAAPQIMTLDGETAHIQVGDRLGFRITTVTDTSSLNSVEFLDVGTQLEVTPTISSDGLVRMKIYPKVSSGSISSDGLPSENTTEAKTDMLVQDTKTVMIGGLLSGSRERSRSGVPILSDLPLIGNLFGSKKWVDNKTEVMILITPHIIPYEATPFMQERIDVEKKSERNIFDGTRRPWNDPSFQKKSDRFDRPQKGDS